MSRRVAQAGAAAVTAALLAWSPTARAAQCRTTSGESFTAAGAARLYTVSVAGCEEAGRVSAAAPAGTVAAKPLSPLLRLYEAPNASVDVVGPRAPRVVSRSVVVTPGAPPRRARTPAPPAAAGVRPPVFRPRSAPGLVRTAYSPAMLAVARAYNIDPVFFASVIHQESGGRADAVSAKGALGVMQVMPGTAARFGVGRGGLANPVVNMAVGASYLKSLQRRYGNNLPLVLAAYNAGEGAVQRHGGHVPPYRETQGYVGGILGAYRHSLTVR